MAKRAATQSEKQYMDRAVALGCALCRRLGYGFTPAAFHHPRTGTGLALRAKHTDGFPLCYGHHQGGPDGIHFMGEHAWERRFKVTEKEFTEETQQLLGFVAEQTISKILPRRVV